MLTKLREVEIRYREIEKQIENPEVISDMAQYSALMREYKQLTPVIEKYREYLSANAGACRRRAAKRKGSAGKA